MNTPFLLVAFAAALALSPLGAEAAAPAAAAASPTAPKRVADISCERYLALPENSRAMLIGWEAGQTFRKGAFAGWVVDAGKASSLVSAVEANCKVRPSASFWYTVRAELKKLKP